LAVLREDASEARRRQQDQIAGILENEIDRLERLREAFLRSDQTLESEIPRVEGVFLEMEDALDEAEERLASFEEWSPLEEDLATARALVGATLLVQRERAWENLEELLAGSDSDPREVCRARQNLDAINLIVFQNYDLVQQITEPALLQRTLAAESRNAFIEATVRRVLPEELRNDLRNGGIIEQMRVELTRYFPAEQTLTYEDIFNRTEAILRRMIDNQRAILTERMVSAHLLSERDLTRIEHRLDRLDNDQIGRAAFVRNWLRGEMLRGVR
jgi:hypothetical protein